MILRETVTLMTHRQHFDLYICSCSSDGGIVRATLDAESGKIKEEGKLSLDRPMYAIEHADKLLVITREGSDEGFGSFITYERDDEGNLRQIGEKLNTGGVVPCHIDASDKGAYVVNYLSGNVRRLGGKTVAHEGCGVHPTRQSSPHTHCVKIAPDGNVLVTDLGIDTVFVYTKDLDLISSAKVPDGFGARHIVFSENGKTVFCVNELVSSVSVFDYSDGVLTPKQTYPAAPKVEGNTAAAIRLVGDKLYVSNRGHDSVAVFTVVGDKLEFEKYISSYGSEPRDFDVFGKFIVCTNQRSNNVTVIDKETGELVSELCVTEPLCVTFISKKEKKNMTYEETRADLLASFRENEALYNEKLSDIEKYRKGKKKIRILDKNGDPVSNKRVKITQKTHEFKYGANIFLLDEFPTEEENKIYRDTFHRYFNLATLPFYWAELEPEEGKLRFDKDSPKMYRRPAPDLCLDYCNEHGVTPKLHCLYYDKFTPDWLPREDRDKMMHLYDKRFREIAERYAGKLWEYEVTNEMLEIGTWDGKKCCLTDEADIIDRCYKKAREYFGEDAKLVINEGNKIPSIARFGFMSPLMLEYRGLIDRGVDIDKIGMQHHAFIGVRGDQIADAPKHKDMFCAEYLDKGLKILQTLGKPMEITEMTVPCIGEGEEGENFQAEAIKYLYTYFFACPNIENITYWNTVDNMCYVGEETGDSWNENACRAGLFRRDLTPKAGARMIHYLFNELWHTELEEQTDENGCVSFCGFYGDYEVSADGKSAEFSHRSKNK